MNQRSHKTAIKLGVIALAFFGFGFAMIPLYDKICEITGLGGRANDEAIAAESLSKEIDEKRSISIEFVARVNTGAPWLFRPKLPSINVHPGEFTTVEFIAESLSEVSATGRAVPSIAPSEGSLYFQKIECFCFTKQDFGPFETKDMPVTFRVDPKLPEYIDTITLSYTFFTLDENNAS